jgi:hypothetical protein
MDIAWTIFTTFLSWAWWLVWNAVWQLIGLAVGPVLLLGLVLFVILWARLGLFGALMELPKMLLGTLRALAHVVASTVEMATGIRLGTLVPEVVRKRLPAVFKTAATSVRVEYRDVKVNVYKKTLAQSLYDLLNLSAIVGGVSGVGTFVCIAYFIQLGYVYFVR